MTLIIPDDDDEFLCVCDTKNLGETMQKTKAIESKLEQQAHSLADFSILNRDRSDDTFVFSDMANHTRASIDQSLVSELLTGATIAPTGDLAGDFEGREVSAAHHGVDDLERSVPLQLNRSGSADLIETRSNETATKDTDVEYILARDALDGSEGADLIGGSDSIDLVMARSGGGRIVGTDKDDSLNGSSKDDRIFGGEGNDEIFGGAGDDILYGDNGNDKLYGGAGDDELRGGNGKDFLYGGDGNDTLHGGAVAHGGDGNDNIFGFSGRNELYGGNGVDKIYAGADNDHVEGGAGGDILRGEGGNDTIKGGEGDDKIYGDGGRDLDGPDGNDKLYGGNGDDYIQGGQGNDIIYGGAGDDYIDSYYLDGDDKITGGEGNDTFKFSAGLSGNDTITDFTSGEDQIIISGTDWDDPTQLEENLSQTEDGVLLTLDDNTSVLLEGLTLEDISVDDFLF